MKLFFKTVGKVENIWLAQDYQVEDRQVRLYIHSLQQL